MKASVKLFLEHKGLLVIGPGQLELIRLVRDLGSLRKAASSLAMSYRWAWGKIKRAEEAIGFPLLVRPSGPAKPACGMPMAPTQEALELLDWFDRMQEEMHNILERGAQHTPACLLPASKRRRRGGAGTR